MKVFTSKQAMQSDGKRAVSGISVLLFLLLLSALTSVSAYQVGETFRECETCPEMVVLPAGKFTMGSPEGEKGRFDNEGPQHRVSIPKPFAVGKYEVTVGQYAEFVRETKHKTENCDYPEGHSWDDPSFKQTNNHPVVCVHWGDALAYTYWLSAKIGHEYRLLTEAEWEYAARAGRTTAYHFGHVLLSNQAQYDNDGTVAVGGFPANVFGLYDMHGNVWEWVDGCWRGDYTGLTMSSELLIGCSDFGSDFRVLRGGSWYDGPEGLRSAVRVGSDAADRNYSFCFRVARTLTP